jgi:hypothetical protein
MEALPGGVTAPLPDAQLVETRLINILHYRSRHLV